MISIVALFLVVSIAAFFFIESSLAKDYIRHRHSISLAEHVRSRPVHFQPAEVRGEEYQRPSGSSPLHVRREDLSTSPVRAAALKQTSASTSIPCSAIEQVHVTLGNTLDSVIVSFVSTVFSTPSDVYFGTDQSSVANSPLSSPAANVNAATGSAVTYSELLYIVGNLYSHTLGAPEQTASYIVSLEDTTSWAYDKVSGEHWANYYQVKSVQQGFGAYNNYYMVYDSPYIHTVTLTGLIPGQVYYYRPAASCIGTVYRVMIPHPGTAAVYPLTIGLTCDLGQTLVSQVSVEAVIALEPDVVLIAGDLPYADGYVPLWDSFGKMIEPLAANVPMLTTGNTIATNHNFINYFKCINYTYELFI